MAIENIEFTAGYIDITYSKGGIKKRWNIADILRAADIPTGLTYTQITSLTALANLVVILVRTLIDRDVLTESFLEDGDVSLDYLVDAIENMGGDYGDPDLTGSET